MAEPGLLPAVLTAGAGSAVGYIASAYITARAQRKTESDKASALVEAATKITDRLLAANTSMEAKIGQLRRTQRDLTDILDILIPLMVGTIPGEVIAEARRVSADAKLTI